MVRRGSTVRVRQRALQKRRTSGFCVQDDLLFVVRAVGMEPFMELSRRERRASSVVAPSGPLSARPDAARIDRPLGSTSNRTVHYERAARPPGTSPYMPEA